MSEQQSQQHDDFDPAAVAAALAADRGETTTEEHQAQGGEPDPKVIEEARVDGWVPKDEWRGDPEKWVDADTFVERGRHIRPILEANNRRLRDELGQVREVLDRTAKMVAERERKAEEIGYQRAKAEIDAEKRAAVQSGDLEAYDNAIQREAALKRPEEPKEEQSKPGTPDPVLQGWMNENAWYTKDNESTQYAISMADYIRNTQPNLEGRPFLDAVKKEVEIRFPNKFSNPARSAPSAVAGATRPAAGGKGRTFNDLPSDAKRVCMQMERMGIKRDDYVKDYFAQEIK